MRRTCDSLGIHFGSKVFPPPFTSILSQIHTIHERKVELFGRLLRRAACSEHFRFSECGLGKVSILSILTKPVVPILTSLYLESVTTLSLTSRPASEAPGRQCLGRHRSLRKSFQEPFSFNFRSPRGSL